MSRASLLRSSVVGAVGTLLSRVTGLARDVAISHAFGASTAADVFWVAFTIPGVFRRFLADEGLTGALIPAVASAEQAEGTAAAHVLANRVLGGLLVAGAAVSAVCIAGAPWLVSLFGWGLRAQPEAFDLAVLLTRWMFPFVVMVSLVSFAEGLLNHRGHFFWPKMAPAAVSLVVAAAALWGSGLVDPPIVAVAVGVLVGGVAHVLMCVPPLWKHWGAVSPTMSGRSDPRFRHIGTELGKVVVIGVFAQINVMVLRSLGTMLETGAVTHYWNATRLVDFAQGAIAVAISSALLPAIAMAAAQQDWGRFERDFSTAMRMAAFVLVPTGAALWALALPATTVLFVHGAFLPEDALRTAAAVQAMVPFMWAVGAINIVKKAFFALDARTSLLWIGAGGVALTGVIGFVLVDSMGVVGLSLALSISTVAQLALYLAHLHFRLGAPLGLRSTGSAVGRMALATLPSAGLANVICRGGAWDAGASDPGNWLRFSLALGLGGVLYAGGCWILRVEEMRASTDAVLRRLRRAP